MNLRQAWMLSHRGRSCFIDGVALSLNLSYLFISHDLAVAQMSQRILVMKDGDLVDQFNREHLFSDERHPYTRELISIF